MQHRLIARICLILYVTAFLAACGQESGQQNNNLFENKQGFVVKIIVANEETGESAEGDIYFADKYAFEFETSDNSLSACYDLILMKWYEAKTSEIITLEKAEEWNQKSWEKSKKSAAKPDASKDTQKILQLFYDPKFVVEETEGGLEIKNEVCQYFIWGDDIKDERLMNMFQYSILNAYRIAMTQRKLPPAYSLVTTEELEKRRLFPREIRMKMSLFQSSVNISSKYFLEELSVNDKNRLTEVVRQYDLNNKFLK